MRIITTILLLALSISTIAFANDDLGLIPLPQNMTIEEGGLVLDNTTSLGFSGGVADDFKTMCANLLRDATGWSIPVQTTGTINFILDPQSGIAEEGYTLTTSVSGGAIIQAATQKGLFYGFQTLRQLMPAEAFSTGPTDPVVTSWQLPIVQISDEPRFPWRGIMVDVSRKFQTKETIMKILDGMAACKLNTFHWHLTDDQGWRVEILQYPLLTSTSGPHYTQAEIREVVTYAELRGITIVPEIDIPSHSSAACNAYPNLRSRDSSGDKLTSGIICAGDEYTYTFLSNVFTEVADLFPGSYVHIGCDEASTSSWTDCPDCQARKTSEGLSSNAELFDYFIKRMRDGLTLLGKKTITWDEALAHNPSQDQVIMSWRGVEPGMQAAEAGHHVVFSPVSSLYFDRRNSRSKYQNPGYSINTVNLNLPYFFEPASPLLSADAQNRVLGAQGNVWGEYIVSAEHVMMQSMMRGCALAESTWSGANQKNWESFVQRADLHRQRLDALGVDYFWEPLSTALEVATLPAGTISSNNGTVSIDVTDFITKSGMSEFVFHRYSGQGTYTVTEVALLKNGTSISKDTHSHTVTVDPRRPNQFYFMWETEYEPSAQYTLRFNATIEGEDNFTAAVLVIPSLNEDDYSLESGPTTTANGQVYTPPATVVAWIGTDGDWETAANWDTGVVPVGSSAVTVGSGFTVNKAGTIDAFTTLTVAEGSAVNFTSTSGNLDDGTQTMNINGTINMGPGAAFGIKNGTSINFGEKGLLATTTPQWHGGTLNISMVVDLQSAAAGTLITHDFWTWANKRSTLSVSESFSELNGETMTRIADNTTPTTQGEYSFFLDQDRYTGGMSVQYVTIASDLMPPAAPTMLSALPGESAVTLDWTDNAEPDLADYTVHRSTNSGSGYAAISTGIAFSSHNDTPVANATTYYYVVTALDANRNESAYSTEVSVTPQLDATDSDGDGMPDNWESIHGFNPVSAGEQGDDPDSDGFTNGFEYITDTDPLDENSWQTFSLEIDPGTSDPTARFSTSVNRRYTIRYRTNLVDGVWQDLGTPSFLGTGSETDIPDPAAGAQRFYRLRIELS